MLYVPDQLQRKYVINRVNPGFINTRQSVERALTVPLALARLVHVLHVIIHMSCMSQSVWKSVRMVTSFILKRSGAYVVVICARRVWMASLMVVVPPATSLISYVSGVCGGKGEEDGGRKRERNRGKEGGGKGSPGRGRRGRQEGRGQVGGVKGRRVERKE